jgi:tyrosine-protein phosphatase YwqE
MWFVSNKTTVRESGLLEGFCDCHSHLLPGVDDGVEEMDETLQILRLWQSVGMKEVWLTPHVMEDIPNEPAALRRRLAALQDRYDGNIRLHLAAEYMMDGLFLPRLEEHDVLTENDHRLLVETSYYIPPMNMEAIIDSIKKKGFEPILAHPERYQYMDKDDYRYWKERGVLMQLNLPSLVGAYGPDVQYKAEWLLQKNMYDYCGTDTHSLEQAELFLDGIISQKVVKKVRRINTLLT